MKSKTKEELIREIEMLQQWIDDLQSGMYINCVYCGHRYEPQDDPKSSMREVLEKHIENCPKHPMSKLKEENIRLQNELAAKEQENFSLRTDLIMMEHESAFKV